METLNLHVFFNNRNDENKFVPAYSNMLHKHMKESSHRFVYLGDRLQNEERQLKFISSNIVSIFKLVFGFNNFDKVVFHSVPRFRTLFLLIIAMFITRPSQSKLFLVLWGGEIYHLSKSLKDKLKSRLSRKYLNLFCGFITYIKKDYEVARRLCKYKVEFVDLGGFYPSNIVEPFEMNTFVKSEGTTNILIGTSALARNNHISIIQHLENFSFEKNVKFYFPLSYGDKAYGDSIAQIAKQKLGTNNVVILGEFMTLEEYRKILASMDIAIFHHLGQQGMGNIRFLLFSGADVYLNRDSTSYEYLDDLGFEICVIDDFSVDKKTNNRELAAKCFSLESTLIKQERFFCKKLMGIS